YPEFIEHVEHALEAQGQRITTRMSETFYQGLLSLMLSLFLDSSKYDVVCEVATNQERSAIVVKPRLGAADDDTTESGDGGSGRESVGVLIEVKHADTDIADILAPPLTVDDAKFIADESKDRMKRARRKLGKGVFRSLEELLAEGYDQILEKKYLDTFNGCCDEVLVVVALFSGRHCLFRFEYFTHLEGDWCFDPESHPIVGDLACPYNWPDM
ncbi:hypothetical protein EV182_005797, partial [Spiromyces aspiralis]